MRYRKLDANGDMQFGHQQLDFYRDQPEAVAQDVQTRLQFWTGEWYLDNSDGTPYMGGIIGKGTDVSADRIISTRILESFGVEGIQDGTYNSQLDRDTRRLSVSCTIDTIYGEAQVTV